MAAHYRMKRTPVPGGHPTMKCKCYFKSDSEDTPSIIPCEIEIVLIYPPVCHCSLIKNSSISSGRNKKNKTCCSHSRFSYTGWFCRWLVLWLWEYSPPSAESDKKESASGREQLMKFLSTLRKPSYIIDCKHYSCSLFLYQCKCFMFIPVSHKMWI